MPMLPLSTGVLALLEQAHLNLEEDLGRSSQASQGNISRKDRVLEHLQGVLSPTAVEKILEDAAVAIGMFLGRPKGRRSWISVLDNHACRASSKCCSPLRTLFGRREAEPSAAGDKMRTAAMHRHAAKEGEDGRQYPNDSMEPGRSAAGYMSRGGCGWRHCVLLLLAMCEQGCEQALWHGVVALADAFTCYADGAVFPTGCEPYRR